MFGSIPTREGEGQEHPEQAGEWHEAWISLHKCAEFLPQAESSVSLSLSMSPFIHHVKVYLALIKCQICYRGSKDYCNSNKLVALVG